MPLFDNEKKNDFICAGLGDLFRNSFVIFNGKSGLPLQLGDIDWTFFTDIMTSHFNGNGLSGVIVFESESDAYTFKQYAQGWTKDRAGNIRVEQVQCQIYDEGYAAGRNDGYEEGYDVGYKDSNAVGNIDDYVKGRQAGWDAAIREIKERCQHHKIELGALLIDMAMEW